MNVQNKYKESCSDDAQKWFVLRIRYSHEEKVNTELQNAQIETYIARHTVAKRINKKIVRKQVPFVSGLLFAHATRFQLEDFMHGSSPMAQYTRFYRDRTKERTDFGKHPPMVISDEVMNSFMLVCEIDNPNSYYYTGKDQEKLVRGAWARVTGGYFKGVEGRIVKIKRQQCLIVDLKGVCSISTAYIPKAFLELEPDK